MSVLLATLIVVAVAGGGFAWFLHFVDNGQHIDDTLPPLPPAPRADDKVPGGKA
jgi:hypothetical protein